MYIAQHLTFITGGV